MLKLGSVLMCVFATDGMLMAMVGSVVEEQLQHFVLQLDHTHQSIETIPIAEVVAVECPGSYLCPVILHNGFVMYRFAIAGALMGMGGNVEGEWGGYSVLVQTIGPHTTGMTLTEEVEDAKWLGNWCCSYIVIMD